MTVIGVVAVAALLIFAYRAAGPQKASSSPEMVAKPAPDFALKTTDGRDVSLSDFRGKTNVLLFFNEGYGCDPCWQQTAQLQKDQQTFADMGVEVYAVMVDQPSLIKSEMARWGLKTIPILVDQTTKVSKSYDALGGMHASKPDHKFVLIGRDGTILWSQDYPSMSVDGDAVVKQVRAMVGASAN
ncbi:MAG: redoxin domain-containing protein [Chloroflexi bacterium]|nr:redoxin domain-containing protein [Chloroflexota bacterium]